MNVESDQLWNAVCGEMSLELSPANFSMWIRPCRVKSILPITDEKYVLEIAVPTGFHRQNIEAKYYSDIKKIVDKVSGKNFDLAISVEDRPVEAEAPQIVKAKTSTGTTSIDKADSGSLFTPQRGESVGENLNPRYLFESYVVGSPNRLAFAAAKSVAENPGSRHNPLFIWGGVGVGKTHLMHAVGHEIVNKGVGKVVCVTSEQFTNDLVSSFRSKMTDAFKKKYRYVGALLIDDVQFFAGKESTQEEFFHTFNELQMKGVQIVMTCDRKPQEIMGLEDRLVSRFLGGMTVDIGLPDYEMKIAILSQKANELHIEVDNDALDVIANSLQTNAREIEGTFVRLATIAGLDGDRLTAKSVQESMGLPANTVQKTSVRPVKVISTVAKYFDYKNKDVLGDSRKADLVKARHITMYILRNTLGIQLTKIGEIMGGRDHTTIMHAVEKIEREMRDNVDVRRKVTALEKALFT
jgi:chromosomal replication initiator protein